MYSSFSSSSAYWETEIQFSQDYIYDHQKEDEKSTKRPPAQLHSKERSSRKIPTKDKIMKKPIAPWPRTPPKVYNVAPVNFRDVVQKLTGAPEFQPTRQHEAASTLAPHEWFPQPSFDLEDQQEQSKMISFGDQETSPRLGLSMSPPPLCMDFMY